MNQPSPVTQRPADREAVAARCQNTKATALDRKFCVFKEEYKFANMAPIKQCRRGCGTRLCRDRCFYSMLAMSDDDLDTKFRMTHFINKCKHTADINACLSDHLDVDAQAIAAANACSAAKCIHMPDYRALFACTLGCQRDLVENVRDLPLEELVKDTDVLGPEAFKTSHAPSPPSLLSCALASLLLLSLAL